MFDDDSMIRVRARHKRGRIREVDYDRRFECPPLFERGKIGIYETMPSQRERQRRRQYTTAKKQMKPSSQCHFRKMVSDKGLTFHEGLYINWYRSAFGNLVLIVFKS